MATHNEDFIAKLAQIEELATFVQGELPQSLLMLRTRAQHIAVLAKTLRARLGTLVLAPIQPSVQLLEKPEKPPHQES